MYTKSEIGSDPARVCVFLYGAEHHSFILFTSADSEQVQGHLK